jgi:hypothetical protein
VVQQQVSKSRIEDEEEMRMSEAGAAMRRSDDEDVRMGGGGDAKINNKYDGRGG